MEKEISSGTNLGIVLIALAAIIALGFGIFAIAKGTTGGYATNFTNSGDFVIPTDLTGDGFFIFEYSGDGVNSTTIQIDDVKLVP